METLIKSPQSFYKIRFNDCDMFGHLNNARYLDYLINARQDHLKQYYGFDYAGQYANNFGWVVSAHEIVYIKPAKFDETVLIRSQLVFANEDLLIPELMMFDEEGKKLKCFLRSNLVPINIASGKREKHKPEMMDLLNEMVVGDSLHLKDLQSRVQTILARA